MSSQVLSGRYNSVVTFIIVVHQTGHRRLDNRYLYHLVFRNQCLFHQVL